MPKHDSLESDMATCEVEAGGWPLILLYIKMSNKLPMVDPNSRSKSFPRNLSKLFERFWNQSFYVTTILLPVPEMNGCHIRFHL